MQQDNYEKELPPPDLDDLVRQIDADLRESAARREQLNFRTWRGLAGAHFDRMFADPENAKQYLSDDDPKLRMAAMSLLSRHFGLGKQLQDQWERMASGDVDPEVRQSAKLCLVRCYREQKNPRAKRLLAEMVKDSFTPGEMRLSLYIALLGMEDLSWQEQREGLPTEIDWDVVDRVLASPD